MIYTDGIFLIGDSESELHQFAISIGLEVKYFNNNGYPCYDIFGFKKKKSYEKGAIKISTDEIVKKMRIFSEKIES